MRISSLHPFHDQHQAHLPSSSVSAPPSPPFFSVVGLDSLWEELGSLTNWESVTCKGVKRVCAYVCVSGRERKRDQWDVCVYGSISTIQEACFGTCLPCLFQALGTQQ